MPTPIEQSHLREAAILTRAVENVLRKFVRLLMGRISLTRLQEMIRLIFVQEAEAFLKREQPGRNVPMTKLALLTGLDTRTLGRLKTELQDTVSIAASADFLRGFTPGFKVLDLWLNDPDYSDVETGQAMSLELTGGKRSFENLVATALPSRGLTYGSILDRLIKNRMVMLDEENGQVSLREEKLIFIGHDELDLFDIGCTSIANLISTVHHNVSHSRSNQGRFFQRSCWTYKLSPENKEQFRSTMTQFLEESNKNVKSAIQPYEDESVAENQITAGVSLFYFEDEGVNRLTQHADN